MSLDAIASLPHYWAHLEPVWDALPERGVRLDAQKLTRQGDAVIVAAWQDLNRAVKAGYRRIAYLEHGIGQSFGNRHPAYPGGRYRDAVSLFLSPNETAAGMDRAAYPRARVEVVGCPKLDMLPRKEDDSGQAQTSHAGSSTVDGTPIVAVSWHWNDQTAPETRSAFGHYRAMLPELAKAFHVIGHAHPRVARQMAKTYAKLGIEFVATFEEVCRRADLLVMDSNSCLYEFASTGRPVVVLNAPFYRRNVNHGLRFWAAANVGLNVDEPAALVPTVLAALDDRHAGRREAALDIAYAYRSGAGQRAAAVIGDWLAADQAVAA